MSDPRIDQARHERNVEKAKRLGVEAERDQLLEGIEAHRKGDFYLCSKCGYAGGASKHEGCDYLAANSVRDQDLYALADRIKSKGTGGDADGQIVVSDETTHATRGGSDQVDGAPEQLHPWHEWPLSSDEEGR